MKTAKIKALIVRIIAIVGMVSVGILNFLNDYYITYVICYILFGVFGGLIIGSFLLRKRKLVAITVPIISSAVITALVIIIDTSLIHGHFYLFGLGCYFDSQPFEVAFLNNILLVNFTVIITAIISVILNLFFKGRNIVQ